MNAVDAADVDHPGRVILGAGRAQRPEEFLHHPERRLHVEVQHPVPGGGGKGFQRLAPGGTGVVDQNVQAIGGGTHLGGQPLAFLLLRQVGGNRADRAELRQLRDGLGALVGFAGTDDDLSAGLQQAAGDHQADTAGSARDQRGLPGQSEQVIQVRFPHHNPSPLR